MYTSMKKKKKSGGVREEPIKMWKEPSMVVHSTGTWKCAIKWEKLQFEKHYISVMVTDWMKVLSDHILNV